MKRVKTHTFNKVKYKIDVEPYTGWCDKSPKPQKNEYPAIRLPNGLPCENKRGAKLALQILLHECLHAEKWYSHEDTVDRVAVEIGNLLWRLGYRRKK